VILSAMSHPQRRTLLFSATLTPSLQELEALAMKNTLRFDLTTSQRIPQQLVQEMLFMPAKVKMCYLVAVLRMHLGIPINGKGGKNDSGDGDGGDRRGSSSARHKNSDHFKKKEERKRRKLAKEKEGEEGGGGDDVQSMLSGLKTAQQGQSTASAIVFVGSCQRCAEISATLLELGIENVALHSLLTQPRRLAALGKFKSSVCRVLLATDVASRGLDIPTVDLVINADLPQVAVDYVHRIGRTARAGRAGRALSLVTPHDISLVEAIEAHTACRLEPSDQVSEESILPLLNPVSKALRMAQQALLEQGFEEQTEVFRKRKKAQRKDILRKRAKMSGGSGGGGRGGGG